MQTCSSCRRPVIADTACEVLVSTVSIVNKRITGTALLAPSSPEHEDPFDFFEVERTRAAGRKTMASLQQVREGRAVFRRLRRRALAVRKSLHHGVAAKPVSQLQIGRAHV